MEAELFASGCCYGENNFTVDDLFDFPNEDEAMTDSFLDNFTGNCSDSSTVTVNSSVSGGETQFSAEVVGRSSDNAQFAGELCVPEDDVAELEWLSNFVDDSFSNDSSQVTNLHNLIPTDTSSSMTRPNSKPGPPAFPSANPSVPGKARSKRSRVAPCDWSSRLLLLQSGPKTTLARTRDAADVLGRTCLHCGSDKTPQWRLGPMGPKTLCNACGVRYKSGRLVPEYRPASSPTFVASKHSNSHRKVLELRRQKEVAGFYGPNGENYLMNRQRDYHNGLNYGHMM